MRTVTIIILGVLSSIPVWAGPGRGLNSADFNSMIAESHEQKVKVAESYQEKVDIRKIDPNVQPNYRPTKEELGIAEAEEVFAPTPAEYTSQEDHSSYHVDQKDLDRIASEVAGQ